MSGQVRNDARSGGALLRIENGNFAYKSGPQILNDINIEVGPGAILVHDGHAPLAERTQPARW